MDQGCVVQLGRNFNFLDISGITIVHPAWLASLGKGTLCTFSKPTKSKDGSYVITPCFGPQGWVLPTMKADL
jgi:ATP-dependent RNA helicase DHX37/DHR1